MSNLHNSQKRQKAFVFASICKTFGERYEQRKITLCEDRESKTPVSASD